MDKWWGLVLAASLGATASAQTSWLTITGDPRDPAVDTVQVNPEPVSTSADRKVMQVRVSRASPRINWDGLPYRSYESQVAFDCGAKAAWYRLISYYTTPLWAGRPELTVDYTGKPRPMLFRDVEPNPTQRIVRAACLSQTD